MKKYIRNINGRIYRRKDLKINEYTGDLVKVNGEQHDVILVDKESDDILELFDELVRIPLYINTKAKPFFIRPFPSNWEERGEDAYAEELRQCLEEQKKMKLRGDNFDLYGAVWTFEGLIYVAELNKKGEWELL